jgi:hypothetical protein
MSKAFFLGLILLLSLSLRTTLPEKKQPFKQNNV